MGGLANAELRGWKIKAHQVFDRIWKRGHATQRPNGRTKAYQWLAEQMQIPIEKCHIGAFDIDQCKITIALARKYWDVYRAP